MDFFPAKDKADTDRIRVRVSFQGESEELEVSKNVGLDTVSLFTLGDKYVSK